MRKKLDNIKWRNILANIQDNVTEPTYKTWFVPLTPLEIDEEAGVLYFATNNEMVVKVLNMRYIPIFEECVENILNHRYKVVVHHLTEDEITERTSARTAKPEPKKTNAAKPVVRIPDDNDFTEEYWLNPKYNFENFIIGANNEYAHAVAVAVAEAPSMVYNPLFIYGGSGLGKTHLMHAIGHYILENNLDSKALYVSSEMFTTELIAAMQDPQNKNKKLQQFRDKYRNVDVLLIDDIQFLEGKEATQSEFFHTFNTLYDLNKQIVITSDRHPSKLSDLDDRLRTRFQWNVIADIQPPDFETRVAILRSKAEDLQIDINKDVLDVINLIAEKVKFNVRELESALTRINSYSKIYNEDITVKYAIRTLSDIFTGGDRDISCESIKKAVCKDYNVKISDIESKKRKREYAFPRQVAMYLCREMTNLSLPQIGKYFGGRDHTTVMHACEKISKEIKENEMFAQHIKKLKDDIY
ncbi:MAG: chromosomal replication initiator protein DnaA [Eubacterium sp.]|nr:chromosomal replication initiator protein DnaA [Candidatus Colimonas fimequi]